LFNGDQGVAAFYCFERGFASQEVDGFLEGIIGWVKALENQADGDADVHGIEAASVGDEHGDAAARFVFERAGSRSETDGHEGDAGEVGAIEFFGGVEVVDVGSADDFEGRAGAPAD